MLCGRSVNKEKYEEKGRLPCGVCGRGVGLNSLLCNKACNKWVHGRCTGIKGKLKRESDNFVCKRCLKSENTGINMQGGKEEGKNVRELDMRGNLNLEVVSNFCYLGDVLDDKGRADSAEC